MAEAIRSPGSVDPAWLARELAKPAATFGLDLGPLAEPLARFASSLLRWNDRINLTGARDAETLVREHIADAFALVPHLPEGPARWLDVGSGAGLPGLVLAVARRDLAGVLLEPMEKRSVFLASAVRELALQRVTVLRERAQDHLRRGGEHSYDVAFARAVFPLPEWLEIGPKLVRPGGVVLGLEGAARTQLPPSAQRLPYDIGSGPRAIVRIQC